MREIFPLKTMRLGVLMGMGALGAGCGSDDGAGLDDLEGTYTATVSGAVTATISGAAFFGTGTDPESGQQAWITYLVTDATTPLASGSNVLFFGLGAPESRSYALQDITEVGEFPDGEAAGMVLVFDGSSLQGFFSSTAGSLTVTSLTATSMDGTFNFTATGTVFDAAGPVPGTVTVQGSFQARGGNFLTPFG